MSEKHSKVRWDKVLKNYRDNYNYEEEWEIAVLELIANAIDAHASTIKIFFSKVNDTHINLICTDNGDGMDAVEFEEYHNLGSLTKTKGGTIGFAGIGAKLTIDLCDSVYTETRKNKKTLASVWWFDNNENEPKYKDDIEPKGNLEYSAGTYVEVKKLCSISISIERIKYLIYTSYQYILSDIDVYVNGVNLKSPIALLREKSAKCKKITNHRGSKISYKGEVFYLDDEAIEALKNFYIDEVGTDEIYTNWFDIVVLGKTIMRGEDFKLILNVPMGEWEKLVGYIRCDKLITAVRTSKDNINKKSRVWKSFYNDAKNMISRWLVNIGVYKEYAEEIRDESFKNEVKELEKDLNALLKDFPEIWETLIPSKSSSTKFGNNTPKEKDKIGGEFIPVPDSTGQDKGSLEPGGEFGRGTHGGPGSSSEPNVPHPGNNDDISAAVDGGEGIHITHKRVRTRYRLGIAWKSLEDKDPVLWDSANSLFIINKDHPAAILADQHLVSRIFYTMHEILRYISENFVEIRNDEEKLEKFWNLYERYLDVLS